VRPFSALLNRIEAVDFLELVVKRGRIDLFLKSQATLVTRHPRSHSGVSMSVGRSTLRLRSVVAFGSGASLQGGFREAPRRRAQS
jgi:hypothetical protein